MDCVILKNGLESNLHKKLISKFGKEIADKKMTFFQSESFLKEFGDYNSLMEQKSDFIPKEFNNRINETYEPELFEDNSGMYYLDNQFQKQYIDIAESKLYNIFQSQRAVNSLVEILGNNYIEKGGFGLDFDTLDMSDNKSKESLLESIKTSLNQLGLDLIQSDNINLINNGGALFQVLEEDASLDELVSKIKDFYQSKQIEYNEDYNREDVDAETEDQRDPIFNQASFKVNPRNKVTSMVKIRLSLIKNPSDIDEDFGQPKSINYSNLYNKMTALLKNNPVTIDNNGKVEDVFETIIDKLKEHSGNIKYLSNVVEYLEKINRIKVDINTKEGINLQYFKAGLVNVMNLQKNTLEYSEISSKEVVVEPAITQDVILPNGAIKKQVIKEAITDFEFLYEKNDATKDTKIEKNIITNWELHLLNYFELKDEAKGLMSENKKKVYKEILDKLNALSNNKKVSNKDKAENIILKLLPSIGITINEAAFSYAVNELKSDKIDDVKLNQNYYNFIDNTIKMFDKLAVNHNQGNQIINTYWYRQIAKAEAFYREDGSESSVFTAGESRYMYSNPSYLHNTTNSWKKSRQLLLDEYNNQTSYEKNSLLYKHLLALDIENNEELQLEKSKERIEKFNVNHFSSFKDKSNKKGKSKTNKDISKSEYIKDTINGLLHVHIDGKTHTRTTTAPGKSTQYNIEHDLFIKSGFNTIDGVKNIDTTVDILFNDYLMPEFLRMNEQYDIVNNGKNLKVYYHVDKKFNTHDENGKLVGNAFKSQLFPSLSFDKIDSSFKIYEDHKLYRPDGSIIIENINFYKQDIIDHIKKKTLEHIDELKSDLIKYNVIEKSGQNQYKSTGIDSRIIKNYSEGAFNLNEDTLFKLMGDLWINGLSNHIEYSKLFSGDVAYYKDSVDYIKRIGASYTDGIYEYVTDINKDFKVGVIESVNIIEPYLKELKEVIKSDEELVKSWEGLINSADAQAWITPQRWKSILLGIGKFTSKHSVVYDKLVNSNEALSTDELKIVAQPLKGVYFDKEKLGSPVYLKYSQAVLIPQLVNNSKLKDILSFMNHHKVDELLTFDAIKAGSTIPTKIHSLEGNVEVYDENGNMKSLNTMTLNSTGWKLQQDLPTKTYKQLHIGTQILKNMLLLISDKIGSLDKIFEHNGKTFSAEEFAKELDGTLGKLVVHGYNDLINEFDIDKNGVIRNIDKFYNTLAGEIVSRDGSSEIVKALKAKLSIYALPGLKNKLDNIFASIVNSRTVKIETNGGSFIQMSNFGLSKDEADSKHNNIKWSPKLNNGDTTKPYSFKLNTDGSKAKNIFGDDIIQPEEILISGSFIAKYIPDYELKTSEELFGTLNEVTGELEGGIIDNKILENIIGYRIPNQGPSSNGAMKIVGILPPGSGDTIVAFTGITTKTGSDFDIDKMYIMFPNYKEDSGNLKYIESNTESKESVQNKVIELYKALILHKSNINKIMTPLDFEHIKMEAQNLAPSKEKGDLDNYEFIQDIVTKFSFLAGLAGVGQEANTSSDYAMGTMSDVYFHDVNLGQRSNQGKSFPVEQTDSHGEYYSNDVPHTKFDKIRSRDISDKELKEWLDSFNKRSKVKLTFNKVQSYKSFAISDNISALMNAFVDIAKDPYITNVNWNMMTTNTGNMMLRAGVHPFVVMSFLAQPIINEYIEFTSQYETRDKSQQVSNSKDAFRIYKVGELIKGNIANIGTFENGSPAEINARTMYDMVTLYHSDLDKLNVNNFLYGKNLDKLKEKVGLPKNYKFTEEDKANIKETAEIILKNHSTFFKENFNDYVIDESLGKLRENVFKYDNDFQSRTFNTFLKFQGFAKKIKSSVDASKYSVNGMGKNTTQLLCAINRIENIDGKGVINYESKELYEDGSKKYLAYLKEYSLFGAKNIVQNNPLLFVSSTPFVWNSYNQVSKDIYGINLEDDAQDGLGDKLDKVFNTYLMSGFEPFDLTSKQKADLVENFPERFIEFKNKYGSKYKILEELNIKKTAERLYITLSNKTNPKEYTDNMINSWRDLLKYYPEFGTDLIRYSFLTSGFNNNTVSFFQFIPPSFFFQHNFNGYVKEFTKNHNDIDENFINHFYLSNLEDSQVTKYVNEGMKLKEQPYLKNGVTLFANSIDKEFINVKGSFYKRIGQRSIDGNLENLYTQYIKVENGYAKIKSLVSEKDKGVTINNFNSKRLSLPLDKSFPKESVLFLNEVIQDSTNKSETTSQEDVFKQEDYTLKEDLTNFNDKSANKESIKYEVENPFETKEELKPKVNDMNELVNHSGGAKGGDMVWDRIGKEFGVTNHNHYTTKYFDDLKQSEKLELSQQYLKTVKWLGRGVISSETYAGKLVRRDMIQANNSDGVFGITELVKPGINGRKGYLNKTDHSVPEGGTAYAVTRGILTNKPVFVFNQSDNYGNEIGWYKWDNELNNFVKTDIPVLTKNYAGIGTQEINDIGKEAIKNVYENTKNSLLEIKELNKSQQLSLFNNLQESKTMSSLKEMFNNGLMLNKFKESGVNSLKDLNSKSDDEIGELLKKICK